MACNFNFSLTLTLSLSVFIHITRCKCTTHGLRTHKHKQTCTVSSDEHYYFMTSRFSFYEIAHIRGRWCNGQTPNDNNSENY